jgi:hypothetical protein
LISDKTISAKSQENLKGIEEIQQQQRRVTNPVYPKSAAVTKIQKGIGPNTMIIYPGQYHFQQSI